MSLSGKNLLVQMRAEGNKSLDFWDIPHEGKRQDASHPEGQHSPATCPSPVPSYQGSSGEPYCFISLWWLQPPMPSRGMWSHKQMVSGWILVSTPWFSH